MNFVTFIAFLLLQGACPATGLRIQTQNMMTHEQQTEMFDKMVTVVMFDHRYLNLFDCWAQHFSNHSSIKNLDVGVFDQEAYDHAVQWKQDHPGVVRSVQHITSDTTHGMELFRSDGGMKWPAMRYQAHYWQIISERLDKGEHVLHMDLDAIATGDPWAAVPDMASAADITSPQHGRDAEFVLFKNTEATREVVHAMSEQWQIWLKSTDIRLEGRGRVKGAPEPDQMALRKYFREQGCAEEKKADKIETCQTHTGKPLHLGSTHGISQAKVCVDGQPGCFVVHGRHVIGQMCENHPDFSEIVKH